MKKYYGILILISTIICLNSYNAIGQGNQIDSFLLVSYDAKYMYMQDFDGTPNVRFLKKMLDDRNYWYKRVDSTDKEDTKIKYRCIVKNRKRLKQFEKLLIECDTISHFDLTNFMRISTRIGLKIYKGNEIEYMFIQTDAPSEYDYDKYIITETTQLRASNVLIRFLKKMKQERRCHRCN